MYKLVQVVCSKCGWSKSEQDPLDWWQKPCPECGHNYVIDKKDMDLIRITGDFEQKVNTGDIKIDETIKDEKGSPAILLGTLKIDSSDLDDPAKSFTCFCCGNKFPNTLKSPITKNKCIMCELFKYKNNL